MAAILALLIELVQAVRRQQLNLLGVDGVRSGEAHGLVGAKLLVQILASHFDRARGDRNHSGVVLRVGVDADVAWLVNQDRAVRGVHLDRCRAGR